MTAAADTVTAAALPDALGEAARAFLSRPQQLCASYLLSSGKIPTRLGQSGTQSITFRPSCRKARRQWTSLT